MGEGLQAIRFRNELEGFSVSDFSQTVITTGGGQSWKLVSETDNLGLPALYGLYRSLDGDDSLYVTGEQGYIIAWK